MRVAVNGAGIAGPAFAYWLHRFGHEPVLIEQAESPRTGGYLVDFWGVGFDIAEKMGVLTELKDRSYDVQEIRWVDADGATKGSVDPDMLRDLAKGRFVSLERGDLAAILLSAVADDVETIFGDSVAAITDHADGVTVGFDHADDREFDLVVGADGLHSRIRDLAFGPFERFEKDLGIRVAAIEVDGYRPREELLFVSHTEPGRQISRFSKRGDRTLFLAGFRDQFAPDQPPRTDAERRQAINGALAGLGWEWPAISEAMADAESIYYDTVSQVHLERWSVGRTALIGDAAAAVSLLAGEGTGLAVKPNSA